MESILQRDPSIWCLRLQYIYMLQLAWSVSLLVLPGFFTFKEYADIEEALWSSILCGFVLLKFKPLECATKITGGAF